MINFIDTTADGFYDMLNQKNIGKEEMKKYSDPSNTNPYPEINKDIYNVKPNLPKEDSSDES